MRSAASRRLAPLRSLSPVFDRPIANGVRGSLPGRGHGARAKGANGQAAPHDWASGLTGSSVLVVRPGHSGSQLCTAETDELPVLGRVGCSILEVILRAVDQKRRSHASWTAKRSAVPRPPG